MTLLCADTWQAPGFHSAGVHPEVELPFKAQKFTASSALQKARLGVTVEEG